MSAPEGARKTGKFVAVCSDPNYAWTPRGGKLKVGVYMIACNLADSLQCSPNVTFAGDPAFLFDSSNAPIVKGNEPGVGHGSGTSGIDGRGDGGIISGINNGIVWVVGHSQSVTVNGIPATRHEDECWMNCKPT